MYDLDDLPPRYSGQLGPAADDLFKFRIWLCTSDQPMIFFAEFSEIELTLNFLGVAGDGGDAQSKDPQSKGA